MIKGAVVSIELQGISHHEPIQAARIDKRLTPAFYVINRSIKLCPKMTAYCPQIPRRSCHQLSTIACTGLIMEQ